MELVAGLWMNAACKSRTWNIERVRGLWMIATCKSRTWKNCNLNKKYMLSFRHCLPPPSRSPFGSIKQITDKCLLLAIMPHLWPPLTLQFQPFNLLYHESIRVTCVFFLVGQNRVTSGPGQMLFKTLFMRLEFCFFLP